MAEASTHVQSARFVRRVRLAARAVRVSTCFFGCTVQFFLGLLLSFFSAVIVAKMKVAVRVLLLLGMCAYSLALVR